MRDRGSTRLLPLLAGVFVSGGRRMCREPRPASIVRFGLWAIALCSLASLTAACSSSSHREIGAIGVLADMGPTAGGGADDHIR
jgi:hypothetical protein